MLKRKIFTFCFDYPDAFIPELWAAESLKILFANSIMLPLVHRDFSSEVQEYGDVVNTRRPGVMTAARKTDADDVSFNTPTATNVPVKLNQHIYQAFVIKDGARSKSFKDLVQVYLEPAIHSIVEMVDRTIMSQGYHFAMAGNVAGKLGTAADEDAVIDAQKVLNDNKVSTMGRSFVVGSKGQADLLKVAQFVEADKIGDDGTALREGAMGRYYGMNFIMSHNAPAILAGNTVAATTVNHGGGYSKGATSIAVTSAAGITAGEFIVIAGDMTPQLVTAKASNTLTITPGLNYAVANTAAVTAYTRGLIDQAVSPAGYAVDYTKTLVVDNFSVSPQIGQMIALDASEIYAAVTTPSITSLLLDRGLDAAVDNNDVVGIGPAGYYNFGFVRDAIGFISRPLALPDATVKSAVVNYNGLGLRITMGYDMTSQGTRVTVDLLAGVKVFNENMGVALLC